MAENFPNYVYEQWLAAKDKDEFIKTLDPMALETLYAENAHHYYREREYPAYAVYLDAVVKNDTDAIDRYKAACQNVKRAFPKVPRG